MVRNIQFVKKKILIKLIDKQINFPRDEEENRHI